MTVAGTNYLVVANSGGNELLVYTLGADGIPIADSKQTYFTGTDPVGLTITTAANDLNHDTIPDVLVANQGSNDVSVFLGHLNADNTWTLLPPAAKLRRSGADRSSSSRTSPASTAPARRTASWTCWSATASRTR